VPLHNEHRKDEQEVMFIDTVLKIRKKVSLPKKKRFVLPALSVQYGCCATDPDGGDDADQ
jgi:hypothetical protein